MDNNNLVSTKWSLRHKGTLHYLIWEEIINEILKGNIPKDLVSTEWGLYHRDTVLHLKWEEIISEILTGNINPTAHIFDDKKNQWVSITEKPEFKFAFPIFPFHELENNLKNIIKQFDNRIIGAVSISSNWKELLQISVSIHTAGLPKGMFFFIPILNKNVKKTINRPISLFQLHDNFLATSFFNENKVVASKNSHLFVLVINVSSRQMDNKIYTYEFPIPEDEKTRLHFSLEPYQFSLKILNVDTFFQYNSYKLHFRSASRKERAAKFGLAAALTGGMLRYDPGYKGFLLNFEIVPP